MRIRHVVYGFLATMLVAFVLLAGLFVWVATGPRSIDAVTSLVEGQLDGITTRANVELGTTSIVWLGFEQRFAIEFNAIRIVDTQGDELISIPRLVLDVDLLSLLLKQKIRIYEAIASDIALTLHRGKTHPHEAATMAYHDVVADALAYYELHESLPVELLRIQDSQLVLQHADYRQEWLLNNVEIELSAYGEQLEIDAEANMQRGEQLVDADVEMIIHPDYSATAYVNATNITPAMLYDVMPALHWLQDAPLMLDVDAEMSIAPSGYVEHVDFAMATDPALRETAPEASIMKERQVVIEGDVQVYAEYEGEQYVPEIRATGRGYNLPVEDIGHYWPPFYEAYERQWLLDHLEQGEVSYATLDLHVKPSDILAKRPSDGTVVSNMHFHDTTLSYFRDLPKVEAANGSLTIDWNSL